MKLLLASKSPRRRELTCQLGYPVEIVDISVDEHIDAPLPAGRIAEHLACRKAEAYTLPLNEDEVIVAADTVVVDDTRVLGKPTSRSEAIDMLRQLAGHSHTVYTGVCLRSASHKISFTEATLVHFIPLADTTIEHYVDTYQPYDKAGSYGIQEWIGMVGIDRIEGCYYNVMGLPLSHLYTELRKFSTK